MVWQQIGDQMSHFKGGRVVLNMVEIPINGSVAPNGSLLPGIEAQDSWQVSGGAHEFEWDSTLDFAREGVKVFRRVSTGT